MTTTAVDQIEKEIERRIERIRASYFAASERLRRSDDEQDKSRCTQLSGSESAMLSLLDYVRTFK